MSEQNAYPSLAKAIIAAQAAMPAVEPDKTNPHFKSRFVSLDNLVAKTRPVLNAHGLAIVQLPASNELGQPVLRTTLLHESGESLHADQPLFLPRQDMQGLGAAITYARRFAWASACGISAIEDDDGNSVAEWATGISIGSRIPNPNPKTDTQTAEPALATKEQKQKIAIRRKEIPGLTDEQYRAAMVERYGVDSATKLTKEQAEDLIASLTEAAKQTGATA